jgi:hypothetical protein
MRKMATVILGIFVLWSCGSRPKNFTCYYNNKETGLDQLIDINGYYVSQYGCDSTFYSMYMFYSNGLFMIATTGQLMPELINCFASGGKSKICRYPLWGTYTIEGDLIKTQTIRQEGNGFVIFRDYRILSDGSIVNVSDYVQPQYINLGYMSNYPSFADNPCEKRATFYPLQTKRDSTECMLLKKKWFLFSSKQ